MTDRAHEPIGAKRTDIANLRGLGETTDDP